MGALTAKFFTQVEAAGFYATLLRDALDLLPDGHGRTLIDIGCGPGTLPRLAAARSYHATGLDSDPGERCREGSSTRSCQQRHATTRSSPGSLSQRRSRNQPTPCSARAAAGVGDEPLRLRKPG